MVTKEITLSSGETVTVYPVPQKVYDLLVVKYPYPPIPIIEISGEDTATGEPMRMAKSSDPDYNRQCAEIDQRRMEEWGEVQFLWALRDVEVPDGWKPPLASIQYILPDWEPRQGEMGRKLDYIEWGLLQNPGDVTRVQRAINELGGIDEEVVKAIESTFPGAVEGEAA